MKAILIIGTASLLSAIALCAGAEEPAKREYAPHDRALLREYIKGPMLSEMLHAVPEDGRTVRGGCPPIYLPALPLKVGGSDVWKSLSGYAAEHVSVGLEEALLAECSNAVARLKELTPSDPEQAALDVAREQALFWARESRGDAVRNPHSVHWNNVLDFEARECVLEACLRTWLEATKDLDGWKAVRSATGTLHGKTFAATGGVAAVTLPSRWIQDQLGQTGDPWEDESPELPVLIRLSPKGVVRNEDSISVPFELLGPFASCESPGMIEAGAMIIKTSGPPESSRN